MEVENSKKKGPSSVTLIHTISLSYGTFKLFWFMKWTMHRQNVHICLPLIWLLHFRIMIHTSPGPHMKHESSYKFPEEIFSRILIDGYFGMAVNHVPNFHIVDAPFWLNDTVLWLSLWTVKFGIIEKAVKSLQRSEHWWLSKKHSFSYHH